MTAHAPTLVDPRRTAHTLRFLAGGARWDPILDVAAYVERFTAVRVIQLALPLEFHAALAYRPPVRPVVVANRRHSEPRRNFSIAHELGHWLLHDGVRPGRVSRTERRRMEWEADRFAVELLLPAPLVRRLLAYRRTGTMTLARRLRVSAAVLRRRLRELDQTLSVDLNPPQPVR